jgi:GST-like protein
MRIYRVFEQRLGECAYLGGDTYTIADIALFPWAALHEYQSLDWSGFVHLPRWFEAIARRPAVAATMQDLQPIMARDAASLAQAPQQALDRFLGRNLPV